LHMFKILKMLTIFKVLNFDSVDNVVTMHNGDTNLTILTILKI